MELLNSTSIFNVRMEQFRKTYKNLQPSCRFIEAYALIQQAIKHDLTSHLQSSFKYDFQTGGFTFQCNCDNHSCQYWYESGPNMDYDDNGDPIEGTENYDDTESYCDCDCNFKCHGIRMVLPTGSSNGRPYILKYIWEDMQTSRGEELE